ncbi:carboxypeptidase regulatory-like domain-containing protein [Myxococcota bacterium]|nr:carboxypeptidase regulatory-like domain-containing protein [Myxococcota bacterium]
MRGDRASDQGQRATSRGDRRGGVRAALGAALASAIIATPFDAHAQAAVCARVRLEIPQRLTLERDAFDANLTLTNELPTTALEAITVTLELRDAAGADASSLVFVAAPTLSGLGAIDGTSSLPGGGVARIHWLFIPTPGAGGTTAAGVSYRARAHITYRLGGNDVPLSSTWADFTVQPQPLLDLVYALPRRVRSDDPMTLTLEPVVPYDLGVRVANVGPGTARSVEIVTAQPRIVQNDLGLLVDFRFVGSEIAGVPGPGSMGLDFGDVASASCVSGAWIMESTLSGSFVDFSATFTHSGRLGGADTSLIRSASTRWLLARVRADGLGADQYDDFVVEEAGAPPTTPNMPPPDGYRLLSSSCVEDAVARIVGASSGVPSASNPTVLVTADLLPGFNVVVAPDPSGGGSSVLRAQRMDGTDLHPLNAWTGPERTEQTALFVFDRVTTPGTYAWNVTYDVSAQDNAPPSSRISAASGPSRHLFAPERWVATPYTVFVATATDAVSGVASVEVSTDGLPFELSRPFYFSSPGEHLARTRATDARGNVEVPRTHTIVVDTAPPAITITRPVTAEIARETTGVFVAWAVEDAVPAEITSSAVITSIPPGTTRTATNGVALTTADLPFGTYELRVTADDWLTQRATAIVGPFFFWPLAPEVVITGVYDGELRSGAVVLTVDAVGWELGPFELFVDGVPVAAGQPITSEGPHVATVTVTDPFGQQATYVVSFTIDSTAPVIAVGGVSDGARTFPGVAADVTVTDATTVTTTLLLDGAPYVSGTPIDAPGTHVLSVHAVDAAGNTSSASVTFDVVTSASLALTVTKAGAPVAGARVVLLRDDPVRSYGGAFTRTDASGAAVLTLTSAPRYHLRVDTAARRDLLGPCVAPPTPAPLAIELPPEPAHARVLHVDAAAGPSGDGSVARPFATLAAALAAATFDTHVRVAHGRYVLPSALEVPEGVALQGGFAPGTFTPDPWGPGSVLEGDGLRVRGALHAALGDLVLEGVAPAITSSAASPLVFDVTIFAGAAPAAIELDGGLPFTDLTNVLVTGGSGAQLALSGGAAVSADLVTLAGGGADAIRVELGASLDLASSIVADVAGVAFAATPSSLTLERVIAFDATGGLLPGGAPSPWTAGELLIADPLFVAGPRHAHYLSQVSAGQPTTSPAVDWGAHTATTAPTADRTTALNNQPDLGALDLGFHARPRALAPPDAGVDGGDAAPADSGVAPDAAEDAGPAEDAAEDAGVEDTGVVPDADVTDAEPVDADAIDAEAHDAAAPDATGGADARADAGEADAGDEETSTDCQCDATGARTTHGLGTFAVLAVLAGLLALRSARRTRRTLGALLVLATLAGTADAAPRDGPQYTVYYGRGFGGSDALQMMGLAAGTEVVVTDTDRNTTLFSGTLDRWSRQTVAVGTRHFRVEAGNPIFAYLGYDCCAFGGTFYYPSTEYSRRTGREFVFFVPVQSGTNTLRLLAYEPTTIEVWRHTATGDVLETTHTLATAPVMWTVPVANQGSYRLVSTGLAALVSNTGNGYDAVPARSGDDTGTEFLFTTHNWGGGGFTVFAYESATVTVTPIGGGTPILSTVMNAGTYVDRNAVGYGAWRLTSTGRVGLWAGDYEGGNTVRHLGDDLSFQQGLDGRELWFHTQLVGATVFASRASTNVTWTNVATGVATSVTLGQNAFLDLPANVFVHLVSSQPVVVESFGGTSLNDYGNLLRPVPPGDLAGFRVTPSATTVTAGVAFDVTVQAVDDLGQPRPAYVGTVSFESSDAAAQLPGAHTFLPSENGGHTFTGLVLTRAGAQTVSALDRSTTPSLVGSTTLTVLPGAPDATTSTFVATPDAPLGDGATIVDLAVTLRDLWGNPISGRSVVITTTRGVPFGAVTELPFGTYHQSIVAPLGEGAADVAVTVDGASFLDATVPFARDLSPPAPVAARATAIDGDGFTLAWDPSTAIDRAGYRFAVVGGTGALVPGATLLAPSTTSTELTGLAACTVHRAAVWVDDLSGNRSASSNVVEVRTAAPGAPSAPTGLVASAHDGYVTLDWSTQGECDVASYRVLRRTLPSGPWIELATNLPLASFVDTLVTNGETYGYVVRAIDLEGLASIDSAEVLASPAEEPPPPPVTGLVAEALPFRRVRLTWDAPPARVVRYLVYRGAGTLDPAALPAPIATTYTTSYQDTPPTDGTWAYTVVWVPSLGQSSTPAAIATATADGTVPTALVSFSRPSPFGVGPVELVLDVSEPIASTPTLTLLPPSGAAAPITLAQTSTAGRWTGRFDVTAATTEGAWTVRFAAIDLAGNAGAGAPLSGASFVVDRTAPEVTIALVPASPVGTGTVTIQLIASEALAEAPALLVTLPGGASAVLPTSGSGFEWLATLFIAPTAPSGLASFDVQLIDLAGNAGDTVLAGRTFELDTTAPATPTGLTVTPRARGRLRVAWTAPVEPPGRSAIYTIVRAPAPGADPESAVVLQRRWPLTVYDETPPADGDWAYAIRAEDSAGNTSAYTALVSGHSDQTPPGAPVNVTAAINGGRVEITWQPASGEPSVAYRVERRRGVADPVTIATGLATTATFDTPPADGTYGYAVTAFDAASNESALSAEASVLFDEAPPELTLVGVESGRTYAAPVTPDVVASDATPVTLTATLDGQPWTLGTEVQTEGRHTLAVTALDGGGRRSSLLVTFTIDLTPPVITISGVTDGQTSQTPVAPVYSVADATATTVTATLDGAPFTSGTPVRSEGPHVLVVSATDAAGLDAEVTVAFTLDLPPPAPGTVTLIADLDLDTVEVVVGDLPSDAATVRVLRDGVVVAEGAASTFQAGSVPTQALIRTTYAVEVVDLGGQVGPRKSVVFYPVALTLESYGRASVDGAWSLSRWMIDELRLRVTTTDLQDQPAGPLHVSLSDEEGTTWFDHTGVTRRTVPASSALAWNAPVHSHRELTDTSFAAIELDFGQQVPGARLVLRRAFTVDVGWPPGEALAISARQLWRGAAGEVSVSVTNQGTAPLGLKTGPQTELSIALASPDGAQIFTTQVVPDTGLPTVTTAEGRFVVVEPGRTVTFPPVAATVPAIGGDVLRITATPERFWGGVGTPDAFAVVGRATDTSHLVTPPPYVATVAPVRAAYRAGETVGLVGSAVDTQTGQPASNVPVSVRIRRGGFEQRRSATTRADGTFALDWVPAPGSAGRFALGADHPSVLTFSEDASVVVHALVAESAFVDVRLRQSTTFELPVTFTNPGDVALDGLTITVHGGTPADGLSALVAASLPTTVPPGGRVVVPVSVTASPTAVYGMRTVTASTAQGAFASTELRITPLGGAAFPAVVPALEPPLLGVGLAAGAVLTRRVLVRNVGFEPWLGVTIVPPAGDLVRVASPLVIGDLEPQGARVVDLAFAPPSGTPTGTSTSTVRFQGTDGHAIELSVSVAVTNDVVGHAVVTVYDATNQLTAPDAPIAGAQVRLVSVESPTTLVPSAQTAADGRAVFLGLPAGNYRYQITADGFAPVDSLDAEGTFEVAPAQTALVEVSMIASPVRVEFTVAPTTITDEYDLVLSTTFETTVPAPVLIPVPAVQSFVLSPGQTMTGELMLYNMGLVSAWNVELRPQVSTYVELAYAVTQIPEIPAQGAVSIPYTVHLKTHGSPPPPSCERQCSGTDVDYEWFCTSAGIWVPRSTSQTVCVDVPICRVETNQSTVTRVTYVNCQGTPQPPSDPLCVTNGTGGEMRLCECGLVTARGIGLPSLSGLLDALSDDCQDKATDLVNDLVNGVVAEADRDLVNDTIDSVNQAKDLFDQAKSLIDAAIASQCDQPGVASAITAALEQAATLLAEAAVEQVLERYTGGIIGYASNELSFETDCLSAGQTTCVDPGDPDFSFGGGTFSFCVQCGSCSDPAQRGPSCPVSVPFVDVTIVCGLTGGSATQVVGGGGGGGGFPIGGGGGGGGGGYTGGACQ